METAPETLQWENKQKRLLALILFRILTITVLLGSSVIINIKTDQPWTRVQYIIFYSIGVTYLLSIFYLLAAKYTRNYVFQSVTQLVGDLIFWSSLVYLTGGLHSPFTFLYTLTIIHGSILLRKFGALLTSSLATVFLILVIWMESNQIFHQSLGLQASFYHFWEFDEVYHFFLNFCMLILTALLASYLAEQLAAREEVLTRQTMSLEMQRMLNRSIVRGISSGFIMTDLRGRVTFINDAAENLIETTRRDCQEKPVVDILPELESGLSRELNGDEWGRRMEITRRENSGQMQWVTAQFSDLLGARQERVGILIQLENITERRKLEEKVFRSEKLAAIGELAAGIAHEIRNPLTSISGSIQMLSADLSEGSDNQKLMEIILRETDRLNLLIDDFLSYARPKSMTTDVVYLQEILEDITHLVEQTTGGRRVHLRTEYEEHLPELYADSNQIRQVLWNVIKNSVESLPDNRPGVVWVTIGRAEASDHRIRFVIRDNGRGMSREVKDRVFDPFYTTKQGGTGLGMAIVYQIIHAHGGTVEVESESGVGTTFTIVLPCRSEEELSRVAAGG